MFKLTKCEAYVEHMIFVRAPSVAGLYRLVIVLQKEGGDYAMQSIPVLVY